MTVVIGIKCNNGIVIACDSQVEFNRGVAVKRLNANKIYKLNENLAVAGAGTVLFIEKAVNGLKNMIEGEENKRKEKLGVKEIIENIAEAVMLNLYKIYDIDRSRFLMSEENQTEKIQEIVDLVLMMGGVDNSNNYLYLIHKNGVAEPVSDYATIGSGAAYAEYLLSKYYVPEISTNIGLKLAIYVIEETKTMDPNVGGPVKLIYITKDEYKELNEENVSEIYKNIKEGERLTNKILKDLIAERIKIEDIKEMIK